MITRRWLMCLCVLTCAACSFSDRHEACVEASDCGNEQACFKGFCVRSDSASGHKLEQVMIADAGARAESKPRPDAGAADTRRSPAGAGGSAAVPELADSGAPSQRSGAAAAGSGGGNTSAPDGEGSHIDAAVSSMSTMSGAGTPAACEPRAEQCNGADDDCDGQTDENTDTACYPDGRAGCTRDAAGRWACTGTCSPGKRACVDGKLRNCEQFRAPSPEVCTELGMQAADEDCNGATDETCACTSGAVSSCYDGRAGTRDVGQCKSGTQMCTEGRLGPCTGQVTPSDELCNGVDDDCNGKIDETFNLKRDQKNCGECGHECASDETCKQGECTAQKMGPSDPPPTEPPPTEEPKGCSPACGSGQTCCGKTCVDINSDANNCGLCANVCVGATKPGCCAGKCVDLVSNQHCGRCGRDCSLLGNGGITCSCGMSGNGDISCTGPVLNLCL